ncbi:(d)CMP kinase [Methylotenera sp. G11]|uniref:(d)CMP kinase n=1 Tax=Methylotenera sp. G11 TaxID=1506585 RepID=UPI000645F2B3|nr:(d)CMP kinase [Methylotenera sp. G11]
MNNTAQNPIPVIAIDGPSASGKGTVAQLVAEALGFGYLDSGALYRVVAFAAKQNNIDWGNAEAVAACATKLDIQFKNAQVYLNNTDISEDIRTEEMGKGASQVAVHAPLRAALVDLQHQFRKTPGLVADGRDMGTVIFPDAQLKIFLTASTETRADRRYKQLLGKGLPADYEAILLDLRERDARDQGRASAPLAMAADAILLETDHLTIAQAVDTVLQNFRHKKTQ